MRLRDGRELVAVADGMGGHSAGEVASQRALETLLGQLRAGADLKAAVLAANSAVFAAAEGNPAWAGMGTTLVAMLRSGSRYEVANVGDSRAYRISGASITQITADHSVAAEAMQDARFASHEVERSRWRNALTRALGTDASVAVDLFGPFDTREPHALVLCTDGVYRALDNAGLLRAVSATRDPWAAARSLTQLAYANESTDNLSAAVVFFNGTPIARRPPALSAERMERQTLISRRNRRLNIGLAIIGALLVVIIATLLRSL